MFKRTDQDLAESIRSSLQCLKMDIEDAQRAGLTVDVPQLLYMYLTNGVASGSWIDWRVFRRYDALASDDTPQSSR